MKILISILIGAPLSVGLCLACGIENRLITGLIGFCIGMIVRIVVDVVWRKKRLPLITFPRMTLD
jgi:hypothetical protein